MMAFMASFGAYAQEVTTTVEEEVVTISEPIFWTEVQIDIDNISYPYVLMIGTPPGTILGISGPSKPNLRTWRADVSGLYITLYQEDLEEILPGTTGRIEIATTSGNYYVEVKGI